MSSLRYATPVATLDAVRERATEAVLGQSGLNHAALAAEIRRRFASTDAEAGALVQQPVLEAALPYVTGTVSLADLAKDRLHPAVVDALTKAGPGRRYAFPRDLKPYRHQLEAWRLLSDATPQSVLVTSGTGSGKTECFLVPLLHDLAREADTVGRLKGVRAIALYPLNALIASQQERLREWTAPFGGRIRFGLYNGDMPEDAAGGTSPPEQVCDRQTLRADPPPILVTNVTMLEYMTVRHQDRPLIEASRGQLRWIILDEAHSYVGSAAAEIALLIRRALLAFGVTPTQVRFVATSATIGEGRDLLAKLRLFLRDIAGVPDDRVHVVVGERRSPELPKPDGPRLLAGGNLEDATAVARNPVVQELIRQLAAAPMPWTAFSDAAQAAGTEPEALLRALAGRSTGEREPLLPLRIHGFLRAVPGLWACLSAECSRKPPGDWPFGALLHARTNTCPHCASAVLEIVTCSECGEPYLDAVERDGRLGPSSAANEADEFASASEAETVTQGDAVEADSDADTDDQRSAAIGRPEIARLIAMRALPGRRHLHVSTADGFVCDEVTEASRDLSVHDRGLPEHCPACTTSTAPDQAGGSLLRPFRYGAPFLIGNAAPVLLDGIPPRDADPALQAPPPSGGRQLLSFTDSRQGTARFAAALQAASERNAVRAVIYHAVQDTLQAPAVDAAAASKLDDEIKQLELVAASAPALAGLLQEKRKDRAALGRPNADGLPWRHMRDILAQRPEVEHWMRQVWRGRDPRFDRDVEDFATFLLLRELARRPRRANALEPLGLARLRFPEIDGLDERRLPVAFRVRGRTIEDWRDFLHILVTVNIRNTFAVRIHPADQHWLIRQGYPRILVGPDRKKEAARELAWPRARSAGRPSIAVSLLAQGLGLGLDVSQAEHRAEINDVLRAAWDSLLLLLTRPGEGALYALDFEKACVAPVVNAYACPVSRRLLDTTFLGLSPYGTERGGRVTGERCAVIEMPRHPNPYLLPQRGGVEMVQVWLAADEQVATLRTRGFWTNLHDRIALGSPYARAAEHSAQQPPTRLRRYEEAFKRGEINVLNCSTTMEMGVDIGSVSSVMMTNVPPSIANYRQRVGRAGRRGQGLSTSLTYARDTPLDRETFRDPAAYLGRRIEAPKVTLDSRRIVQRHVNALLLAAWFQEAQGQVLKTKAGDFFGCPPTVPAVRTPDAPSSRFRDWAVLPSTAQSLARAVETLLRGSALAGHSDVYAATAAAVLDAERAFIAEWTAIQAQAVGLDRDAARKALGLQVKRMCGEYLLGELADRGVLPGHGFPTAVVPFVHKDDPDEEAGRQTDGDRFRRRGHPTRNLDLAIRDYAPGAEVVVDGLVYGSAGVTLNWQRPAAADAIAEVQSLKWFWECSHCGAADTTRLHPEQCAACGQAIDGGSVRRFLEPAGFTVDPREKPHAEIEQVRFIEPEPERVVARSAVWKPFLTPARGRMRASHEGLVFYASSGEHGAGYAVCLECGRAEAHQHLIDPGARPLREHRPLRFTKADADGFCPGNGRSFAIQTGLALGHDIVTDVAEIQPAALVSSGAAWALASGLREALTRRLGIETGELGLSIVRRLSPLGGTTHSVYIYDRAAGGAGFAPRLVEMFEELLRDTRTILDCSQPGCSGGCSACVLASDLYAQAEMLDRHTALAFVEAELDAIAGPSVEDQAEDGAILSRDVADELVARTRLGVGDVILWPATPFDPVSLSRPRMHTLFGRLQEAGRTVTLCLTDELLGHLDAAQRLALRDAAIRHELYLATGTTPRFRHSARAVAALTGGRTWASRDEASAAFGDNWGLGQQAPIVAFEGSPPVCTPLDRNVLLPKHGTKFIEPGRRLDGPSRSIGERFLKLVRPELEAAGLWQPTRLTSITYSDRYVRSPLVALLVCRVVARLAAALSGSQRPTFRLTTTLLKYQDSTAHRISHDWRLEADREIVLGHLCKLGGLDLDLKVGPCSHSRRLTLTYEGGSAAALVLDQGLGFLNPAAQAPRFNFQDNAALQAKQLNTMDISCSSDGTSYIVVVAS